MLTPTYVKSFLKKYAEYLGLDARHMVSEYAKLRPAHSTQAVQVSIRNKAEGAPSIDLSKYAPAIKRAAVLVISIALVMFVGGKVVKGIKQWKKARASTSAVKKQTKSIRSTPAPLKKEAVAKAVAAPSQAAISKTTPLKLLVSVKQTVLVKVRADGNLLFSKVLTRGSVESFNAKDRFNIYVAKGEAVEFYLNGKNLGFAGKGPLKDVEVTRNGLKVK